MDGEGKFPTVPKSNKHKVNLSGSMTFWGILLFTFTLSAVGDFLYESMEGRG